MVTECSPWFDKDQDQSERQGDGGFERAQPQARDAALHAAEGRESSVAAEVLNPALNKNSCELERTKKQEGKLQRSVFGAGHFPPSALSCFWLSPDHDLSAFRFDSKVMSGMYQ